MTAKGPNFYFQDKDIQGLILFHHLIFFIYLFPFFISCASGLGTDPFLLLAPFLCQVLRSPTDASEGMEGDGRASGHPFTHSRSRSISIRVRMEKWESEGLIHHLYLASVLLVIIW